jgi:hypothetical protein
VDLSLSTELCEKYNNPAALFPSAFSPISVFIHGRGAAELIMMRNNIDSREPPARLTAVWYNAG